MPATSKVLPDLAVELEDEETAMIKLTLGPLIHHNITKRFKGTSKTQQFL